MHKKPPLLLIVFIIGVPAVLTLAMLWPQIQQRVQETRDEETTKQPVDDKDAESTTSNQNSDRVVAEDNAAADDMRPATLEQPSAFEKSADASRKQFDLAKASYDRVAQSADSELLQRFGSEVWSEIQALVALAEKLPQPLAAAEKYSKAETLLRELSTDLPTRKLLFELTELKSQKQYLPFLTKLTASSDSTPTIRERLAPFWLEVSGWDAETWLTVIRRECLDLSPDDGGFADVYHALADFHRDTGSSQAAIEAEEIAWENALRMTNATRAAQSALRAMQRLPATTTPSSVRSDRFEKTKTFVREVADTSDRMELLAELACLPNQTDASNLLNEIQNVSQASRINLRLYWPAIYRCKVLAETQSPSDLFDVCVSIPKYNGRIGFDPFAANTMGYAYAATAAARTNDQSSFWKAMLLAEAQQLDDSGTELRTQRACAALGAADLRQKNFGRVVFTAMNLREPAMQPKLLFPVMIESGEDVPEQVAISLIQRYGDADLGCVAVAKYLPSLMARFESEAEAISWILKLSVRSVRIAAMIGYARHRVAPKMSGQIQHNPPAQIDVTDSRSLLELADSEAALLQVPMDRAWAQLWIAACWHILDQPASYAGALTKSDDALALAWRTHWDRIEENDRRSHYRNNRERDLELSRIIDFYATLAELQAYFLKDPSRAIENVINAARASQPLNDGNGGLKMRLWIISEAIHRDCGIPPGTLESVFVPPNDYHRLLLASRQQDLSSLVSYLKRIETQGIGKGYEAPDYLARAYAELAMLSAKTGDIETYRSARRKSAGIITSKGSVDSIFLPLHEADSYAGEFALAINRKRNLGPLTLYGTPGRTSSALCTQLSLASRTADAINELPSTSEPFYRLQAMHAIAAARSKSTPSDQLIRWQNEQSEELDRIAILCGLACRKPIP